MISLEPLDLAWADFDKTVEYAIRIGGFTIGISSTDAPLAERLMRAFAHLPKGSLAADLAVRIWSGPKLPTLDWSLIQANGYRGYGKGAIYFHYFETIQCLSAVDVEKNIAYFIVRDRESLPWWVNGSPLQVIFHVWFREKRMQLTHCAGVGNGVRTVLLAGRGGSGKSTTVLACLKEGLSTLGEDYVLLSKERAYSVYQTAKWERRTRTFFPDYDSYIANPEVADREKALVYYGDLFPSQMALSAPIQAIISLSVGSIARLEKADTRVSLQNLLLSTVMQLPHSDSRIASSIEEFISSMDHYRLVLGPDLKENVSLIRRAL